MTVKRKRIDMTGRRVVLDDTKKEEMLAVLIRNKEAFEAARPLLQVRHLKLMNEGLALVWRTVNELYDTLSGQLPASGQLRIALNQALKANPEVIPEDDREVVDEFLDYAYDDAEHGKNISQSKTHTALATATCRQFLEEVATVEIRDRMLAQGTIPADMVAELNRARGELEVIGSLSEVDLEQPFPEGWDKEDATQLFTSGVDTLDKFMGEGWCAGEVILFMGPFGSCKTLLACHGVARLINYCGTLYTKQLKAWRKLLKKGEKVKAPRCPTVVLIFTEGSKRDYRNRLLSNLAQVPWKKLQRMASVRDLSACNRPAGKAKEENTEYELHEFKDEKKGNTKFYCEQERIRQATVLFNRHLVMIDCTDSSTSLHRIGKGGIPEIANVVNTYFRKHADAYPLAFWLDHASALARRYVSGIEGGMSDNRLLRTVLNGMPLECRDRLAVPYKCPVAIMHQMSGEANKRSPTARMHHTDGSETTSMAEYTDFAIVTGIPDHEQRAVFRCTKHRREPPSPERVVCVDGNFNRVLDWHDNYYVSGTDIVARTEVTVHGANEKRKEEEEEEDTPRRRRRRRSEESEGW